MLLSVVLCYFVRAILQCLLYAVDIRSSGNNSIISIKVIKILVSIENSCMLTTSTSTGVKKDICCSGVNGHWKSLYAADYLPNLIDLYFIISSH